MRSVRDLRLVRALSFPPSPRHSRESGNPDGCNQAHHPKSGTNAVNGSLLPSWEKARMRVSSRASAALRAGRPRSQAAKPTPVSLLWEKVRMRARRACARLCGRGRPRSQARDGANGVRNPVFTMTVPMDSRFRGNPWGGNGNGGISGYSEQRRRGEMKP